MSSVSDTKEERDEAKKSNNSNEEGFIEHKTNTSAEGNNSTATKEPETADPHNYIDYTSRTSSMPSSSERERHVVEYIFNIDTDTKQILIVIKFS